MASICCCQVHTGCFLLSQSFQSEAARQEFVILNVHGYCNANRLSQVFTGDSCLDVSLVPRDAIEKWELVHE